MSSIFKALSLVLALFVALANLHPLDLVLIDEPQLEPEDGVIDLSALGSNLFSEPDESVGKIVNDWTPEDGQNPEELGSYLEGDMLIPTVEGRNGLVSTASRWPNGVVPYIISPSLGSSGTNMILRAMDEYHAKTCIRFVPRTNEKDYISIESSSTGCWSSVGRVGKRQSVNLQNPGCLSKIGTPIHELMHALGFMHEQNRNDRDSFVRIIKSNIKPGEKYYSYAVKESVNSFVNMPDTLPNFEKAAPGETTAYGVQYDTGSVMHYSSTAFSKNGQKTIEALVSISTQFLFLINH